MMRYLSSLLLVLAIFSPLGAEEQTESPLGLSNQQVSQFLTEIKANFQKKRKEKACNQLF